MNLAEMGRGGLVQNVFMEWVEPEVAASGRDVVRSGPVRVIAVTDAMRREDARVRAERERAEASGRRSGWVLKAELSEANLRAEAKRDEAARRAAVKIVRRCAGCMDGLGRRVKGERCRRCACAAAKVRREEAAAEWAANAAAGAGLRVARRAVRKDAVAKPVRYGPEPKVSVCEWCEVRVAGAKRGRKPRLRPCKYCAVVFGCEGMRKHLPQCEKRPAQYMGRAVVLARARTFRALPVGYGGGSDVRVVR